MKKQIFIIAILIVGMGYSQTLQEKEIIRKSYNQERINKTYKEIKKQEDQREARVENYFKKNRLVLKRRFEKEGVVYGVRDILPDGTILYNRTHNHGSAKSIRVTSLNTGGKLNLNLNGENMIAGVWDGGVAQKNHIEFPNNKVIIKEKEEEYNYHATHVTGTIVGVGKWPGNANYPAGASKGMAPQASVFAYDWDGDINEMFDFAEKENLVSNHSYGYSAYDPDTGWVLPTWYFGAYNADSYNADLVSSSFPKYQIVTSAGNDRGDYDKINLSKKGYDLLTGISVSKNTLTVAAVEEVVNYIQPSDVKMSTFSNYGPTDDGRIKPNISAKGVRVFSAYYNKEVPEATNYYAALPGTSMASPAITGGILLLQQHYNGLNKVYMNSSTVRGLIQHTALEAGTTEGPDYSFGWGLADFETAALAISNRNEGFSIIEEKTLEDSGNYTQSFSVAESSPLLVSLSWTEPPSMSYNKGVLDPNINYLVNDLDIKVTDEQGKEYFPWKLDGKNPSAPATQNSTNDVDNFERIDILNPKPGKYTLTVSHKGKLINDYDENKNPLYGPQEYTIIVTGSNLKTLGTEEVSVKSYNSKIYPVPAKNILNISIEESTNYSIYEITGKLISSGKLKAGENTLNVSNFSKGIYILKLGNGSKVETKKIIIE